MLGEKFLRTCMKSLRGDYTSHKFKHPIFMSRLSRVYHARSSIVYDSVEWGVREAVYAGLVTLTTEMWYGITDHIRRDLLGDEDET